jgi:radical SAM protein with 4Fe4S-binding SPASM domain
MVQLKTVELKAPVWVQLEVTGRCNLDCEFCYYKGIRSHIRGEELTLQQIKTIIDKTADAEVFRVQITGGEPFLRPDLYEIIEYIHERGLFSQVVTNGVLIGEEEAAALKELGIYSIQVSLCGSTSELHDSLTGVHGSFEKTVNGIKELVSHGVSTYINMTTVKKNYRDVSNTVEVARDLGIRNFTVTRFVPNKEINLEDLRMGEAEFFEVLTQLYKSQRGGISPYMLISFPYCVTPEPEKLIGHVSKCGGAFYWMCISPNGEVRPCTCLPHTAGNLLEVSVEDAWNSSLFREIRDLSYIPPECRFCRYGAFCMGGCRAASYFEKGDLSATDPLYEPHLSE